MNPAVAILGNRFQRTYHGRSDNDSHHRGAVIVSLGDRLRVHVRENRRGLIHDLMFAVIWVSLVSVFFQLVDGPQWAYYMFMLAGIPAYFGFFISLEMALEQNRSR